MPSQPEVVSVNVGQPTAVQTARRTAISGIRKHAVPGRVQVGLAGLEGDHVLDRRHHGGPDQAVYVYTAEDYAAWEALLGRALPAGIFGENLLVSGMESASMRVGDQLCLSEVTLEVCAPRIPCATLAGVMEDPTFVKRFAAVGRPGFYTRVLQTGTVGAGDRVDLRPTTEEAPTIAELFGLSFQRQRDPEQLRRMMAFPLAERLMAECREWLERAERA
ncbi:MOSC domain-containing protein [Deinococcus lacus]|uniref:MOSC domain-containing protein n=1 Tax=Deinococcus lacus TaxID=392561 RepID=A0ABW1YET7_9DEIO